MSPILQKRETTSQANKRSFTRDLALITGFKATSDLPQWMTPPEREQLRAFLKAAPDVRQVDRYVYSIDDRTVDFSPAVSLPGPTRGWTAVWASILGWLANIPLVLKIYLRIEGRKISKRRESL